MEVFFRSRLSYYFTQSSMFCAIREFFEFFFCSSLEAPACTGTLLCCALLTQFTTSSPEPASLPQHPSVSSVNLDNKDVFVNGSYCRFYFVYV